MSDYWLAVILGIIEGLTEFLPISSTGHLLIAQQLLKVPLDEDPFWKMFTVVIQLPAIFAVVVYYFPRLRTLIADFFAKKSIYPVPRWRHPVILVLAARRLAVCSTALRRLSFRCNVRSKFPLSQRPDHRCNSAYSMRLKAEGSPPSHFPRREQC